jgi:hypothetical protein
MSAILIAFINGKLASWANEIPARILISSNSWINGFLLFQQGKGICQQLFHAPDCVVPAVF